MESGLDECWIVDPINETIMEDLSKLLILKDLPIS